MTNLLDNIKNELGNQIKVLRKEKGWSQEKLGSEINKSNRYISLIENGKINPTLETIVQLATALEVHPVYLLGGENLENYSELISLLSTRDKLILNEIIQSFLNH